MPVGSYLPPALPGILASIERATRAIRSGFLRLDVLVGCTYELTHNTSPVRASSTDARSTTGGLVVVTRGQYIQLIYRDDTHTITQ